MNRREILRNAALLGAAVQLTPETVWAAAAADWTLGFADVEDNLGPTEMVRLHGQAPAALNGDLYRNGPAKFRRPGGAAGHWFDGDGMVRRFRIAEGRAEVSARFVETAKRRQDSAANAVVTPGFGTLAAPGAVMAGPDDANAANTSVLMVGGELWALWEAGSPTALDPESLETRSIRTLRADLKSMPFLAHPRVQPDGRIWNIGVEGQRAIIWRLAPGGALEKAEVIDLPRASYVHDFTATARHLILVLQPWLPHGARGPTALSRVWRPELGCLVVVLDKDDLSQRRILELPAFFFFHLGDAWEESDGAIRFDACVDEDPSGIAAHGGALLRGQPLSAPPTQLAMITLRPDGRGELSKTGVSAEFPRADSRFAGHRRRYSIHLTNERANRPLFQGLAVRDWRDEVDHVFDFGPRRLVEEAVFVPHPGGSGELEGWLVGTTVNLDARATELHVFDPRRLSEGPLVSWRAPRAFPVSFHGVFAQAR